MRMMQRNRQRFRYALYSGPPDYVKDADGNLTGALNLPYGAPREGYANISAATGNVRDEGFGAAVDYDKVICARTDFGMTEQSVLWIDDVDGPRHDYVVARIARSLNHVRIAVRKVTNNGPAS